VTPLLERIGVTRVADVTGLDRAGIPNFTTVRPRERGEGLSYYNGKGVTRTAAHAGALMEAVERYTAELCDLPIHCCTFEEIQQHGPAVDPDSLIAPRAMKYQRDLALEWIEGFDFVSEQGIFLPLNAVLYPYFPPEGRSVLYDAGTNGLASGNTVEEALCHGICEVIERDAMAVSDAWIDLAPSVARVLQNLGVTIPTSNLSNDERFPLIDLETLPPRALMLVRKFQRAGILVYLRDITSTARIATLDCTIVERQLDGRCLAHGGTGSHPDARVAATRALSEASQSRVGHIQGGREDLVRIVGGQGTFDPDEVYGRRTVRPFSSVASFEHSRIDEEIRFLLERLKEDGFKHVIAVDLTRPEVGIPVVRVVIPGTEAWSVYVNHGRRGQFGPRIAKILHDGIARSVTAAKSTVAGT
jgi:ribosomal protein S12 methylthiotransferase accessory factor